MSQVISLTNTVLRDVEKPSRYVGGELNSVYKTEAIAVRFALCFPDLYEIGMSNLAISLLYQLLNAREDTWCERVFAPAADMRDHMMRQGWPLFSLESKTPLTGFDWVGFTLQYELSYVTILDMLQLGGIPLRSKDRTEDHPLVVAGGPCAVNIEPMADVFDLVVIGEAELVLPQLIERWQTRTSKRDFLENACTLEGVYVPAFYEPQYTAGRLIGFTKHVAAAPLPVRRTIVKNLDDAFMPVKPIVPNQEIVHDRMVLELFRGCARGCRFCQAGQIYRPVREHSVKRLVEQAQQLFKATGYDELGLLSLSTSDYTGLAELTDQLVPELTAKHVNVSLPSLRLDTFSFELMEKASQTRKAGLTFAIEAGSQRLRNSINKNIFEEDVLAAVRVAFAGGWRTLKFYLMLGLPGETDEDVLAIADIIYKVIDLYYALPKEERGKAPTINVSTSFFIPKPWTPYQWVAQVETATYNRRQKMLAEKLRHRFIHYNWHDADMAVIEAVLARGDRRLLPVIEDVVAHGGTLDSWREHFSYERWLKAMHEHGIDAATYIKGSEREAVLPWDLLDVAVTKHHLWREWERAGEDLLSDDCRLDCAHCGVQRFGCGICLTHVS